MGTKHLRLTSLNKLMAFFGIGHLVHIPPQHKNAFRGVGGARGAPRRRILAKKHPQKSDVQGGKGFNGALLTPKKRKKNLPNIYCVTATCHMPWMPIQKFYLEEEKIPRSIIVIFLSTTCLSESELPWNKIMAFFGISHLEHIPPPPEKCVLGGQREKGGPRGAFFCTFMAFFAENWYGTP